MTIAYNPSIPQSNDLISNSQPQILQNFGSINTLIGIDHYSFASGSGGTPPAGEHKQITFGSTNPASPNPPGQVTVSPPVLFTNTVDGAGNALPNTVPELFFYSGTHQEGQDNYVSTAQGSVLLFGGIVMKWGNGSIATGGAGSPVSFPVAFPNNCFSVVVSGRNSGNTPGTFTVNAVSASSFTLYANTSGNFYYIAIGN